MDRAAGWDTDPVVVESRYDVRVQAAPLLSRNRRGNLTLANPCYSSSGARLSGWPRLRSFRRALVDVDGRLATAAGLILLLVRCNEVDCFSRWFCGFAHAE